MIEVKHSRGRYAVEFVSLDRVREEVAKTFVVTDENVYEAHRELFTACPSGTVVPAGENSKSLGVYGDLLQKLAEESVRRDGAVAAVGGGVVGDLAGFAAASYMRGIDLLMVPTSLLAQVDSSVGGKVAIDLPQGKNLVGAFHAPQSVLICLDLLETLPERQFRNGAAEIWKYGAIDDRELFERLESAPLESDAKDLEDVIGRCIQIKANVVAEDEFETSGRRAILNFGHTVGHAIEHQLYAKGMLHGEAIAIGMVLEAEIGEEIGVTEPGTADRLRQGLSSQELPTEIPEGVSCEKIITAMGRDKKALQSGIRLSLLSEVGACKLSDTVSTEVLTRILLKHERC